MLNSVELLGMFLYVDKVRDAATLEFARITPVLAKAVRNLTMDGIIVRLLRAKKSGTEIGQETVPDVVVLLVGYSHRTELIFAFVNVLSCLIPHHPLMPHTSSSTFKSYHDDFTSCQTQPFRSNPVAGVRGISLSSPHLCR
jgi:hypothetical protein